MKRRGYLEDGGVDRGVILNCILGKQTERLWMRCIWLRVGTVGGKYWKLRETDVLIPRNSVIMLGIL
jgi:hypothetical protein